MRHQQYPARVTPSQRNRRCCDVRGISDCGAGSENVFLGKGYVGYFHGSIDAGYFHGSIDEVRIWNRARSADEIKEDRHHRLVGREPGLVGYWRFDENTGSRVYDQTDSANNGTIHGATWEKSEALIGSHPGISRDSFSFAGRTIESGLTAVHYFQQEDAQVGNGQENKPMKTNARVMLAVATGGKDASGSATDNKYIAALDFAVSREGKLAQVPDNLSLNWINRTDIGGGSIESSFGEVARLEGEISQLKLDISQTEEISSKINLARQERLEAYHSISDFTWLVWSKLEYTREMIPDPDTDHWPQIDARILLRDSMYNRFFSDYVRRQHSQYDETFERINRATQTISTLTHNLQTSSDLIEHKRQELSSKQVELERTKEQLYGQVSLPMSWLHTDSDGLITSGALLGFAHTSDTPQLFDSAMGKLALYFQGTNEQCFTAYYDTKTARAQQVIDIGGGKIHFLARTIGAESNAATITIGDGNSRDTCKVTIANPQIGITETWEEVPTGEVGVIYFDSGEQFSYHGDESKTKSLYSPQGWRTLGDIGRIDEEGYIYLTDRKSNMIISGGVNVYPQESENRLLTHPKVADVAVFGIPNVAFGEEVKAVVQPASGVTPSKELESELIEYCKAVLAPLKCPRSIDFDSALPRQDNGKLYKRKLVERYISD